MDLPVDESLLHIMDLGLATWNFFCHSIRFMQDPMQLHWSTTIKSIVYSFFIFYFFFSFFMKTLACTYLISEFWTKSGESKLWIHICLVHNLDYKTNTGFTLVANFSIDKPVREYAFVSGEANFNEFDVMT